MFTGIIEDVGRLIQQRRSPAGAALRVGTGLPVEEIRAGDSIAVNGVCLTVTGIETGWFEADMSHETLEATTLGALRQGDAVHLEQALALGGRLGGRGDGAGALFQAGGLLGDPGLLGGEFGELLLHRLDLLGLGGVLHQGLLGLLQGGGHLGQALLRELQLADLAAGKDELERENGLLNQRSRRSISANAGRTSPSPRAHSR